MLVLLLCVQANALPLSLTFGEHHQASFVYQDGQTYMSLGHEHGHRHHHLSKHHHTHEAASIFNGHDGVHTDHLIQILDSETSTLITTIQYSSLDSPVAATNLFTELAHTVDHKPVVPYELNRTDQGLILRKNSVQFLA